METSLRTRWFGAVGCFLLLLPAVTVAAQAQGLVEEQDLMVPMRDGVRLATDIYRPSGGERLPVLLLRTPYDKSGRSVAEQARFFARNGYVVAIQDCRGRYRSEGVFTKYVGEGQDTYDTIEWLASRPFSNGNVGMWGTSYSAHVQANAAKLKPPHLRTIVLNMGGMSNGWDHKIRNHGAFEMQQMTWAFSQLEAETQDPIIRESIGKVNVRDWLMAMPFRKGLNPLSVAPNFEDYILEMMTRADYDDYWKQLDVNWVEHYDQTADIPMLHISGWYDSYAGGTVHNFEALRKRLKSSVRLIMGPWTHGGNTRTFAGEVEFGSAAAIADFSREFHLRWFDEHLKGRQDASRRMPEVQVFVMGGGDGHRTAEGRMMHGGEWMSAETWPLPGTRPTPFYLGPGGVMSLEKPGVHAGQSTFLYDPDDPVPTIGGAFSSTSPIFESGAYDQREREDFFGSRPPYLPLRARRDVLVFQTEPLEEDMVIAGPVTIFLHASSSAVDTDFTAKLIDVYPPSADYPEGFEMNLTDGIVRARYRESAETARLMDPGQVYEIRVEPFPTANRFRKGHRIRLDISSSNFPRFDVNPNTGEPLGKDRLGQVAENSIHHNSKYPSRVILPVIEGR